MEGLNLNEIVNQYGIPLTLLFVFALSFASVYRREKQAGAKMTEAISDIAQTQTRRAEQLLIDLDRVRNTSQLERDQLANRISEMESQLAEKDGGQDQTRQKLSDLERQLLKCEMESKQRVDLAVSAANLAARIQIERLNREIGILRSLLIARNDPKNQL